MQPGKRNHRATRLQRNGLEANVGTLFFSCIWLQLTLEAVGNAIKAQDS